MTRIMRQDLDVQKDLYSDAFKHVTAPSLFLKTKHSLGEL